MGEHTANLKCTRFQIHILPLQGDQLTLAHTCAQRKQKQALIGIASDSLHKLLYLTFGERLNFVVLLPRRSHTFAHITSNEIPPDSSIQCLMQDVVHGTNGCPRKPLFHFQLVESLQILWRQLLQLNAPQPWYQMQTQILMIP